MLDARWTAADGSGLHRWYCNDVGFMRSEPCLLEALPAAPAHLRRRLATRPAGVAAIRIESVVQILEEREMRKALLALLVALAMFATACGGSDDGESASILALDR